MFGEGKIEIINDEKDFKLIVNGNKPTVELMLGMLFMQLLKNGFDKSDIELLLNASDIYHKDNKKEFKEIIEEVLNIYEGEDKNE